MKLQLPQNGSKVVPDNYRATITNLNGADIAVVNGEFYVHYTLFGYNQFCKDAGYCDYTDMLPESIEEKPIHSNESLLAYCYYYISEWVHIEQQINHHLEQIEKLKALK